MSRVSESENNSAVTRDFFLFSVLKELRPKYRIWFFGILWTLGQPFLSSLVVTYVFKNKLSTFIIPQNYFFFCFGGLSFWTFFSSAINQSGLVFQNRVKLVKSSSNSRFCIALAPVTALFLELLFSLCFALLIFEFFNVLSPKPLMILGIFLSALLAFIFTASTALFISVMSLELRDLRYLIPFLIQLGFLTTPIIYEAPLTGIWGTLYHSTPLALAMRLYRWTLGLHTFPSSTYFLAGLAITLLWGIFCAIFFRVKSRKLAEWL